MGACLGVGLQGGVILLLQLFVSAYSLRINLLRLLHRER